MAADELILSGGTTSTGTLQQSVIGIVGPAGVPASAYFYVGPTPPADTTLIWIKTP